MENEYAKSRACVPCMPLCFFCDVPDSWHSFFVGCLFLVCILLGVPFLRRALFLVCLFLGVPFQIFGVLFSGVPSFGVPLFWRAFFLFWRAIFFASLFSCMPYCWRALFRHAFSCFGVPFFMCAFFLACLFSGNPPIFTPSLDLAILDSPANVQIKQIYGSRKEICMHFYQNNLYAFLSISRTTAQFYTSPYCPTLSHESTYDLY